MQKQQQLDSFFEQMVTEVTIAIENARIEGYTDFLNSMYHYTLLSGERLRHASNNALSENEKAIFSELAGEEDPHFKLAIEDLKEFGLLPKPMVNNLVDDFHSYWMSRTNTEEWLGVLYILEGIGEHIGNIAKINLARLGIKPNQAKFILEHLEADEIHSKLVTDLCLNANNFDLVEKGAKYASAFWTQLHINSLKQ